MRYAYIFNRHKRPYYFIHCIEKTASRSEVVQTHKTNQYSSQDQKTNLEKKKKNDKFFQLQHHPTSMSEAAQSVRSVLRYKIHIT